MARFCVVVIAVCCLVTGFCDHFVFSAAATRECSVERSGVLTMFNGQTSTVAVPCKYRLADIQCGDYRLVVTPGSQLDSDNTFSPDTVLVNIISTGLKENLFVRTTARRLQKIAEGKADNPWREKQGDLTSFGFDLAGYDSAKQAAVLRKDGVFAVEFSADQASVVVRCFSDSFSSKSQPDALCGDGESGTSVTKEEILGMVFSSKDVGQSSRPSCLRAVSVYQQCAAANASDTRVCNEILLQQATVDCLAGSDTPLIDHYRRCLETACNLNNSAVDPMIRYIDDNNCALDPGSDCSAVTFVRCDPNSVCEGGAICKRRLDQTCAGFSDHCMNGTTCDPDTNLCTAVNSEPCGKYKYGFRCQYSEKCIPYHFTCDGDSNLDCDDDSDEALAWCPPPEECTGPHRFQCDSGECIPIDFRCDDYDDCGDVSDEKHCSEYLCLHSDWRCADEKCVKKHDVCDGEEDCTDGSDERNCLEHECLPDYWKCTDGICVKKAYVCDGEEDCSDGSDERNCLDHECVPDYWKCTDGICVKKAYVCDGEEDCSDGSDERNCLDHECVRTYWKCTDGICVKRAYVCDGEEDCTDGSDERNCLDHECVPTYWKCTDGICITKSYVCDGEEDCDDGSDELPENCH